MDNHIKNNTLGEMNTIMIEHPYLHLYLMMKHNKGCFLGNPQPQWQGPWGQTPTGNKQGGKRREREEEELGEKQKRKRL